MCFGCNDGRQCGIPVWTTVQVPELPVGVACCPCYMWHANSASRLPNNGYLSALTSVQARTKNGNRIECVSWTPLINRIYIATTSYSYKCRTYYRASSSYLRATVYNYSVLMWTALHCPLCCILQTKLTSTCGQTSFVFLHAAP